MTSPFASSEKQYPDKVLREKRQYGLIYGAVSGIAFALALWGWDGYWLYRAHTLYPWLKVSVGIATYAMLGSLAGALAARLERTELAALLWAIVAVPLAWLSIALPLQIAPWLITRLHPNLQGLIVSAENTGLEVRFLIALVWALIFLGMIGLLQLALTESAVFSTAALGKILPLLVCLLLAGIHGTIVDGLANEPLRSSVLSLENTLEFYVEHQGQHIEPALARRMHVGALGAIRDLATAPWRMVISRFDQGLGEIEILVQFPRGWAKCLVLYNQPGFCQALPPGQP